MGARMQGIGSVLAVTAAVLCAGVGTAGSASAAPPWGDHCTGAKAKVEKEKPFIIQACQCAYSAAARIGETADIDTDVADAEDAAKATEYAAKMAQDAWEHAKDKAEIASGKAEEAGPEDEAARVAALRADEYQKQADLVYQSAGAANDKPLDVKAANDAADDEEKAVEASRKAFKRPGSVKISRVSEKK